MKPVEFEEANHIYGAGQPEYLELPAHRVKDDPKGTALFCWQLSWRERLRVLCTGRIWHWVLTFRQPLQPQMLQADKPSFSRP